MIAHYDCRHFLGHKPCIFRRECDGCPHYAPFGKRILIIKLAALGDVLRTTPLLRGLQACLPRLPHHMADRTDVMPMLQGVSGIDRLLPFSFESDPPAAA